VLVTSAEKGYVATDMSTALTSPLGEVKEAGTDRYPAIIEPESMRMGRGITAPLRRCTIRLDEWSQHQN